MGAAETDSDSPLYNAARPGRGTWGKRRGTGMRYPTRTLLPPRVSYETASEEVLCLLSGLAACP